MGFLDDLLDDDMIWVALLLLLVCILPQKCSQPIIKEKCCVEEDIRPDKDIIYRRNRDKKERRLLVY